MFQELNVFEITEGNPENYASTHPSCENFGMNEIVAICAGVGLAAACGFRIFVPLFIASLAANFGLEIPMTDAQTFQNLLGENFDWLGNDLITVALGLATTLEVGAYYIPWLDNALDTIATPAAVVAGTFISGALMPELISDGSGKWLLAMIAGGGTSGLIQSASVVTRGASTVTTGGVGNPVVSTAELGGAVVTAGIAVFIPILAAIVVIFFMYFALRKLFRVTRR